MISAQTKILQAHVHKAGETMRARHTGLVTINNKEILDLSSNVFMNFAERHGLVSTCAPPPENVGLLINSAIFIWMCSVQPVALFASTNLFWTLTTSLSPFTGLCGVSWWKPCGNVVTSKRMYAWGRIIGLMCVVCCCTGALCWCFPLTHSTTPRSTGHAPLSSYLRGGCLPVRKSLVLAQQMHTCRLVWELVCARWERLCHYGRTSVFSKHCFVVHCLKVDV